MDSAELSGHVQTVEECRDWIAAEATECDSGGRLYDFADSLRVVLDQNARLRDECERLRTLVVDTEHYLSRCGLLQQCNPVLRERLYAEVHAVGLVPDGEKHEQGGIS